MDLSADGSLRADRLSSGKDLTLKGGKNVTVQEAKAGGKITARSQEGSIIAPSLEAGENVELAAAQDVSVPYVKAGGVINADAGRNLSLNAAAGSRIHEANAGNDATIIADGDVTIDHANAENSMYVAVRGGDLKAGELPEGKDANLEASALTVSATGKEVPAGNEDGEGEAKTVFVGGNIGEKDNPIVTGLKNEAELTARADENIYLKNVGGPLNVKEVSTKNGDAELGSEGDINVAMARTGKDLVLSSDKNITVDHTDAGGNAAINAKETADVTNTTAGGDLLVSGDKGAAAKASKAKNITVTSSESDAAGENLEAEENLDVVAKGKATLKDSNAENIRVTSTDGDAAGEKLEASGDLEVTAKKDAVGATVAFGLSAALRPAAYSVTRRVDGALRTQSFPVMVLIDDNGGTVEDVTLAGLGKVYKLFVIQKEWPEPTPPHAGAWFTLFDGTRLAVQKVERKMPNAFLIYATQQGDDAAWLYP